MTFVPRVFARLNWALLLPGVFIATIFLVPRRTFAEFLENSLRLYDVAEFEPRGSKYISGLSPLTETTVAEDHVLALTFHVYAKTVSDEHEHVEYDIALRAPARKPSEGSNLTTIVPPGSPTTADCGYHHGIGTTQDQSITFYVPASDGTVDMCVKKTWFDGTSPNWVAKTDYLKYRLTITRRSCDDAAVDSRRTFGQPNAEGIIQPTENDPYSTLNFGSWKYNGGLYVGVMQPRSVTTDRSGVARIQLWPQGSAPSSSTVFATVTLRYLGKGKYRSPNTYPVGTALPAATEAGFPDIGAYVRAPSDSNAARTDSDVDWDTRWGIDPKDEELGLGVTNRPDQYYAILRDALSGSNNWYNWPITRVNLTTDYLTDNFTYGVALARPNENALASGTATLTTPEWVNFASNEYSALVTGREWGPRVWTIDYCDQSSTWNPWL